jgi:two-component system chemotaxis response regulator CheB
MSTFPGASARDVILIGGSQGSIPVLKRLLAGLPREFRAAVGVTVHRSPTFASSLADVLGVHARMPVCEGRDGQLFEQGRVYLAPPDHHMQFRGGAVWLDRGPKQQFVRPAIDVMFASGAASYGPRVIGVLLTGNLSDGVAGLIRIKQHGGLSLVQEPADAEAPSMPINAISYDDVDIAFNSDSAPNLLAQLVAGASLDRASRVPGVRRLPRKQQPPALRTGQQQNSMRVGAYDRTAVGVLADLQRLRRR